MIVPRTISPSCFQPSCQSGAPVRSSHWPNKTFQVFACPNFDRLQKLFPCDPLKGFLSGEFLQDAAKPFPTHRA